MSYTLPSDGNAIGSTGHVTDHNNIVDVITGMGAVLNARNTAYAGGADPTGANDSTSALQAAANAGLAYLPPGTYKVTSPITISTAGGGLIGNHGRWYHGTAGGAVLVPTSGFSGSSIINVTGAEVEVGGFTIDCSAISSAAAIDGLDVTGNITGWYLHDLLIRNAPRYGVQFVFSGGSPFSGNAYRVIVDGTGNSAGFNIANVTDAMFLDCYAIGCSGQGWYILGNGGTKLVGCRAEWSTSGVGYQIDGNGGFRNFQMVGCNTDRNAQHGLNFTCTGTDPVLISGFNANRDGASSTSSSYAGINIASGVTNPICIGDFNVTTGKNDDGTGNATPQFGVSFASGTSPKLVQLSNGLVAAITTAMNLSASTNFHTRNIYTCTGFPLPSTFTYFTDLT